MARKNRVSLPDSMYHITARTVNGAFLFDAASFKDQMVDWLYGVARFCGVNVLAWCLLDNHIHLLVHIPKVPHRYWIGADEPPTHAFTLRPPPVNPPRWSPSDGDTPGEDRFFKSTRPPVRFALPDSEMENRLTSLYANSERAKNIVRRWTELRAEGQNALVEEEQTSFCRRMYNVSQFAKTFLQVVAQRYNVMTKRTGQLWSGRFHSGVVERSAFVSGIVSSYIDYNPVRAGLVKNAAWYRWSSWGQASGMGTYAECCRQGYETLFGVDWNIARDLVERAIADRLVKGGGGVIRPRASQAIKKRVPILSRGAFIGVGDDFLLSVSAALPFRVPVSSPSRAVEACRQLDWTWPPKALSA